MVITSAKNESFQALIPWLLDAALVCFLDSTVYLAATSARGTPDNDGVANDVKKTVVADSGTRLA